jgi:hypothetical protein
VESLLWRDQVAEVVVGGIEVDLDPVDPAGELVAARPIVLRHDRAALHADVAGIVSGAWTRPTLEWLFEQNTV